MENNLMLGSLMDSLVSISRFNKGEANKIFEELKETGYKIVLKNNTPTCVLLTPELYEEMVETIEDYRLQIEAEKRLKYSKEEEVISSVELLEELGIKEEELLDIEVEID